MQEDFCGRFMSQRCSAQWDPYCTAYLYGSEVDQGGFQHVNKKFLAEVAKKKYCRQASGAPGSHCASRCESFLPTGQTSVQICETVGAQNWLDTKEQQDLGGNFPQSARLNPLSPIYLGYCPETCDASGLTDPDALGPDDAVLNKCIEHGACSQILNDLAYNVVKSGIPVSNPAFQKIIDYAKLDKPVNPNVAAKIAKSFGIPPEVAIGVMEEAKYAMPSVNSPVQTNIPITGAIMPKLASIVVAPTIGAREGFSVTKPCGTNALAQSITPTQSISKPVKTFGIVAAVIIALIIIYLLYTKFSGSGKASRFY
jgi:hypothetical protein